MTEGPLSRVDPTNDLFEANPLAIVIVGADDRIQRLNPAFTELFGYTEYEAQHRRLSDLIVPTERRDEGLEINRRTLAGERVTVESVRRHKDGSPIDVAITTVPFGGDGDESAIYIVYQDVSERVRADAERMRLERQLHSERTWLETILHSMPIGVVAVEAPSGRVVLSSDRVDERVRACIDHLAEGGHRTDPTVEPDCPIVRALRSGETVNGDIREFAGPDDRRMTFSINASPIRDGRGAITGAVASFEDITEQRRLEASYRTVVDKSLQGLGIMQDGRVVFANARFSGFLGCQDEAEAKALSADAIVAMFHPDDREAAHRRARDREAGRVVDHEYDIRFSPPGRPMRHFRAFTTVVTHDGRPASQVALIDTTEQVALRDSLREARHLETLGQLSTGLSHEINTPSQYVGDNLEFLAESWADVAGFITEIRGLERHLRASDATVSAADALAGTLDRFEVDFLAQEVPHALAAAKDGNRRIARIVSAMKTLASLVPGESGMLDLNATIEALVMTSRHEWEAVADVLLDLSPAVEPIGCRPVELCRALHRILLSTIDRVRLARSGDSDRRPTIVVRTRPVDGGVELTVGNEGTVASGFCSCSVSRTGAPADCPDFVASDVHGIIGVLHRGALGCATADGGIVATRVWLPSERPGESQ